MVPNASVGDPQSLNLYSYVENNPITGIDPDGHFRVDHNSNAPTTDWNCAPGYCTNAEISSSVDTKYHTITYSVTTYEATQSPDTGEWNVTKTTVTTTFSTSEKNPGAFVSGSSQSTMGTSSNLNEGVVWGSPGISQAIGKSSAQKALGAYTFSAQEKDASEMSAPGLGTTFKRDIHDHPRKYAMAVVDIGLLFVPFVGEANAAKDTVEAYKISFELHKAAIDLAISLNEK